jgi:hypothetical protein
MNTKNNLEKTQSKFASEGEANEIAGERMK